MSPLYLLISCLIVLVIAGVLLWIHLVTLQRDLDASWQDLLQKLHLRLDKIPRLLETIKPFIDHNILMDVIAKRTALWPMDKPDRERVEKELEFDTQLQDLLKTIEQNQEIKHQTNYLASLEELVSVKREIETLTEQYNKKVRSYNHYRLFGVIGVKHRPIFEME